MNDEYPIEEFDRLGFWGMKCVEKSTRKQIMELEDCGEGGCGND